MSRNRTRLLSLFALFACVVGSSGAALAQGVIRVEPRPFYGAVVTMEEGVRVFRPLPADRYIVINPGHGTPLSLGIQDTRVYERRTIHNYDHGGGRASGGSYAYSGAGYVPGYARHGRGYNKRDGRRSGVGVVRRRASRHHRRH